jgi:lactate dehydrogenase-like 2-hydroxyacid dehydrogenase
VAEKQRVLVTQRISDEALVRLASRFDVESNQNDAALSPAQLQRKLRDKDGAITLITDVISEKLLATTPRLKVVSNVAVGYNNFDVAAATRRGVMLTNTPGAMDDTTADFAWCLILATARRLIDSDRLVRSGRWTRWRFMANLGWDVYGKTIGICGFGRIGRGVARRAAGFNMRVIYTGPRRAPGDVERELNATFVDKQTLLRDSDVVSLHLPLFPDTRHYVGAAELALMKPTAILINTARGPVVDERALVKTLKAGRIAGAGLDVYENEPKLAAGLAKLPNTVLAPHMASASVDTRLRMCLMAVANCTAALTGQRPPNLLNPDAIK